LLAVSGTNKSIQICNIYASLPEKTFTCTDTQWALAELPNRQLATGSGEGIIRLWDLTQRMENACTYSYQNEGKHLICRILYNDNTNELAYTSSNEIVLMDIQKRGRANKIFSGHKYVINDIAFVNDSGPNKIVSVSDDKTIKIWDCTTTRCLITIEGHDHFVRNVAVLHEGMVLSGGFDSILRYWKVGTGECLDSVKTPWNHILQVAKYKQTSIFCCGNGKNIKVYSF